MLGVEPTYFNSIKVQLELPSLRQKKSRMINFNSIKVQLEHLDCSDTQVLHHHFNSIKVQLEHYQGQPMGRRYRQFQFHKGTIRTCNSTVRVTEC